MSKIKNGGLDQCDAGPFEQQQFGTADVEGVKRIILSNAYLVGDFDEQGEDDDNKQVVKYAENSNEDVADFESNVTDVSNISCQIIICRRVCRQIVPDINCQRCVLHGY